MKRSVSRAPPCRGLPSTRASPRKFRQKGASKRKSPNRHPRPCCRRGADQPAARLPHHRALSAGAGLQGRDEACRPPWLPVKGADLLRCCDAKSTPYFPGRGARLCLDLTQTCPVWPGAPSAVSAVSCHLSQWVCSPARVCASATQSGPPPQGKRAHVTHCTWHTCSSRWDTGTDKSSLSQGDEESKGLCSEAAQRSASRGRGIVHAAAGSRPLPTTQHLPQRAQPHETSASVASAPRNHRALGMTTTSFSWRDTQTQDVHGWNTTHQPRGTTPHPGHKTGEHPGRGGTAGRKRERQRRVQGWAGTGHRVPGLPQAAGHTAVCPDSGLRAPRERVILFMDTSQV